MHQPDFLMDRNVSYIPYILSAKHNALSIAATQKQSPKRAHGTHW